MKRTPKIIFVCLLLLTILAMFLPVARFEDNSGAAIDGDIAKQEERVAADEAKLERDTKAGKDQATLDKQKNKIEKGKAKLNDLLAQKAAMSEAGSGLVYSLLPARLPAELKLNEEHINSYKVLARLVPGRCRGGIARPDCDEPAEIHADLCKWQGHCKSRHRLLFQSRSRHCKVSL